MPHFNEHTLEMAIMELFEQQGYSYMNGETIHKEQTEVLLRDDLRMYLMDRYAQEGITPLEAERVIAKLTADNGASLYQQNALLTGIYSRLSINWRLRAKRNAFLMGLSM